MFSINQSSLYPILESSWGSVGPEIETMMQWKVFTAFGTKKLASTICHCLNFQQGTTIKGKTKKHHHKIDVLCECH